jgi:DNA-binding NarL/FixJ family response regulator
MLMASQLSDEARTILERIAEGYTFAQVLQHYSASQIQDAAREALEIAAALHPPAVAPDRRAKTNLRTYEVWTEKEDALLMDMVENGIAIPEIAAELERHPMTVRRRIAYLNLT